VLLFRSDQLTAVTAKTTSITTYVAGTTAASQKSTTSQDAPFSTGTAILQMQQCAPTIMILRGILMSRLCNVLGRDLARMCLAVTKLAIAMHHPAPKRIQAASVITGAPVGTREYRED